MSEAKTITAKKYDAALIERVRKVRQNLGPQPLARLWSLDPDLEQDKASHPKLRRILSSKVFPGDRAEVERLEAAKLKLLRALKK